MANPPQGGYGYGYQYQGYLGEAANPPPPYYYTGSWPEQPPAPSDGAPFRYRYQHQDDADCITFLRGWYVRSTFFFLGGSRFDRL
jgi:hypothetical protein